MIYLVDPETAVKQKCIPFVCTAFCKPGNVYYPMYGIDPLEA